MDDQQDDHEHADKVDWTELARIAFVAAAAVGVWFRIWEPFARVIMLGVVGTLGGGWPIFHEACPPRHDRNPSVSLPVRPGRLEVARLDDR